MDNKKIIALRRPRSEPLGSEIRAVFLLSATAIALLILVLVGILTRVYGSESRTNDMSESTTEIASHNLFSKHTLTYASAAGILEVARRMYQYQIDWPGGVRAAELHPPVHRDPVEDQPTTFRPIHLLKADADGAIPELDPNCLLSEDSAVQTYESRDKTFDGLACPDGNVVPLSDLFGSRVYHDMALDPGIVSHFLDRHVGRHGDIIFGSLYPNSGRNPTHLPPGLCLQLIWAPAIRDTFQYGQYDPRNIFLNAPVFPCARFPTMIPTDFSGFKTELFRADVVIQHTLMHDPRISTVDSDQPLFRLGPLTNSTAELRPRRSRFGAYDSDLQQTSELVIQGRASFCRGRQLHTPGFGSRVTRDGTMMLWMVKAPQTAKWLGDYLDPFLDITEREAVYYAGQQLKYRKRVIIPVPESVIFTGCQFLERQSGYLGEFGIPVPKKHQKIVGQETLLFTRSVNFAFRTSAERKAQYRQACLDLERYDFGLRGDSIFDGARNIELRLIEEG